MYPGSQVRSQYTNEYYFVVDKPYQENKIPRHKSIQENTLVLEANTIYNTDKIISEPTGVILPQKCKLILPPGTWLQCCLDTSIAIRITFEMVVELC